jgi:hypothetical protein
MKIRKIPSILGDINGLDEVKNDFYIKSEIGDFISYNLEISIDILVGAIIQKRENVLNQLKLNMKKLIMNI